MASHGYFWDQELTFFVERHILLAGHAVFELKRRKRFGQSMVMGFAKVRLSSLGFGQPVQDTVKLTSSRGTIVGKLHYQLSIQSRNTSAVVSGQPENVGMSLPSSYGHHDERKRQPYRPYYSTNDAIHSPGMGSTSTAVNYWGTHTGTPTTIHQLVHGSSVHTGVPAKMHHSLHDPRAHTGHALPYSPNANPGNQVTALGAVPIRIQNIPSDAPENGSVESMEEKSTHSSTQGVVFPCSTHGVASQYSTHGAASQYSTHGSVHGSVHHGRRQLTCTPLIQPGHSNEAAIPISPSIIAAQSFLPANTNIVTCGQLPSSYSAHHPQPMAAYRTTLTPPKTSLYRQQ